VVQLFLSLRILPSPTRWYSKYEGLKQVADHYPDVIKFVQTRKDTGIMKRLKKMIADSFYLPLEICAWAELMRVLSETCYFRNQW